MKGTPKKRQTGIDPDFADDAIARANHLTDITARPTVDKSAAGSKLIPVRVNAVDYNKLKGLFGSQGLALARAGSLALFYVAEQLEAGKLTMNKAGIIDRRG